MSDIFVELAFLRNHLMKKIFQKEDYMLLNKTIEMILNSESPFMGVALWSLKICEIEIKEGDFVSAANQINFIHNFPFKNYKVWNSNYFYKIEFPNYIEKINDSKKIKEVIREISKLEEKLNELKNTEEGRFFDQK